MMVTFTNNRSDGTTRELMGMPLPEFPEYVIVSWPTTCPCCGSETAEYEGYDSVTGARVTGTFETIEEAQEKARSRIVPLNELNKRRAIFNKHIALARAGTPWNDEAFMADLKEAKS